MFLLVYEIPLTLKINIENYYKMHLTQGVFYVLIRYICLIPNLIVEPTNLNTNRMPFDNLINNHYTSAEKTTILDSLTSINTILNAKLRNLSTEERRKFGSINEQNKLIVNKVRDFRNSQPNLSSPDVDWAEFQNDFDSRDFIHAALAYLKAMIDGLENNKILHDYDNYQAALTDYIYSQYKAGTNSVGFETKLNEIAQFFIRKGTKNTIVPPVIP